MSQPENEIIGVFNGARVMSKYPEYMSDLFGVSYIDGGTETNGFGKYTPIFNDNITLRMKSPKTSKESRALDIAAARLAIRQYLGDGVRVMRADNDRDVESVKFLVTLGDNSMSATLDILEQGLPPLRKSGLSLADIDFTIDCENITTRAHVERWIDNRYPIVDRRDRTGDNCISWQMDDDRFEKFRSKLYNKAVQMIESGGVRVALGSSMHEYIAEGVAVQNSVMSYKSTGISRLELTFYGDVLYPASTYREVLMDVYKQLSTCVTYKNSLANQWKALEPRLTQVLAVYEPETKFFAMCQWWNSLTGKMHGTSTKINKAEDLMKLLGNYSFNNRPIHLITLTERNEAVSSYIRVGTSQPVTMLPGVKGGLYSARKDGMKRLEEYGLGSVTPGRLDWVPHMSYRTGALADLTPYTKNEPDIDSLTRDLENLTVNNKTFEAVYVGLKENSTYTIVGVGMAMFRKNECTYVTTSTGQRVRCGAYLEKIVKDLESRGNFHVFTIRTGRIITKNGCKDIQCYIA